MEETLLATRAIAAVNESEISFCKFLSANDTGETGAHQAGIYIPKPAVKILFDEKFSRGENHDRWVEIAWHDGKVTHNRFIYYGRSTRNEYRITQFGRGFEYLSEEHTGDLFVLCKLDSDSYRGFILSTDDEIDTFLSEFALSPSDTGQLISKGVEPLSVDQESKFQEFFNQHKLAFPSTYEMSLQARQIEDEIHNRARDVIVDPDRKLLAWNKMEYDLFRFFERCYYETNIGNRKLDVDRFIELANSLLNRRKSRAGKSLEHHLSHIFTKNELSFSEQKVTEGNSRPDFIFPDIGAYHNSNFPLEKLIFLAAKTTCKDRWRQILREADRIPVKYLFTLQQGISPKQLAEMEKDNVKLVVPKENINLFPDPYRPKLMTLLQFIRLAKQ